MNNLKIRTAIMSKGLRHWEVADALGISEATFVRMMRHELPDDDRDRILEIIERMQGGATNDD